MKNKFLLTLVIVVSLLSFPNINFGQAINLGTLSNYVLFSGAGAIGNTGISQITGNMGTNVGAISGFGNVNGVINNANAATIQGVTDLNAAYNQLNATINTDSLGPVLGNGDTLNAGVHYLAAAGSLVSVLTLNAQGDPNAVFIFKTGGAFTTAASSSINLINGAVACNVFWRAEGAISMAASTIMRGTLISNGGAIDMGDGGLLEGRALARTGAVSVYGTLAYRPLGCGSPVLTGPVPPTLGPVECFTLFSSVGHVTNSGVTNIDGDVGTNDGSTTGYDPLLVTGMIHLTPDGSTAQTAFDLPNLVNYLGALPYDIELLYPAQFGNKLVLTPHTYRMNAAAHLVDTVSLNAEGNADAIFVIQINGALTTGSNSKVKLINGAQSKNVYWKVTGAVSIADNSVFNGTIVNDGAINLNTAVTLNGRALTTSGLITTTAMTANKPAFCSFYLLPTKLLSFKGVCDNQNTILKWSTATETNIKYFTLERSGEGVSWQLVGTVQGAGNSFVLHTYSLTDRLSGNGVFYYRIKQTDFYGNYKYGEVLSFKKCGLGTTENLTLYPNPSAGKFDLVFTGDKSQVYSTEIFNSRGQRVFESYGFQSKFDLSNKTPGMYFLRIHTNSKTINRIIVVEK